MQPGWKRRALVWLVLAESARANRAAFPRLPTAWLPHLTTNSAALWLPELLAALDRAGRLDERLAGSATASAVHGALRRLCVDNPGWLFYVAPAAIAYAVSHPRFNIYKGPMAEVTVAGFGLDAIPHSLTAFALARLMQDGLAVLDDALPPASPLAPLARALARHPRAASALFIALLTLIWEIGEHRVQQIELAATGGDPEAINMQWTMENTIYDVLSNAFGWLAAGA